MPSIGRSGRTPNYTVSSVERLAIRESLPPWAAARLSNEYGESAEKLARSLNERAPLTLRCNTLQATAAELQSALAQIGIECEAGTWSPWALRLKGHHNVF